MFVLNPISKYDYIVNWYNQLEIRFLPANFMLPFLLEQELKRKDGNSSFSGIILENIRKK